MIVQLCPEPVLPLLPLEELDALEELEDEDPVDDARPVLPVLPLLPALPEDEALALVRPVDELPVAPAPDPAPPRITQSRSSQRSGGRQSLSTLHVSLARI